jgi:hypothetical protein
MKEEGSSWEFRTSVVQEAFLRQADQVVDGLHLAGLDCSLRAGAMV